MFLPQIQAQEGTVPGRIRIQIVGNLPRKIWLRIDRLIGSFCQFLSGFKHKKSPVLLQISVIKEYWYHFNCQVDWILALLGDEDYETIFISVKNAHLVLSDQATRRQYDKECRKKNITKGPMEWSVTSETEIYEGKQHFCLGFIHKESGNPTQICHTVIQAKPTPFLSAGCNLYS